MADSVDARLAALKTQATIALILEVFPEATADQKVAVTSLIVTYGRTMVNLVSEVTQRFYDN